MLKLTARTSERLETSRQFFNQPGFTIPNNRLGAEFLASELSVNERRRLRVLLQRQPILDHDTAIGAPNAVLLELREAARKVFRRHAEQ